jgi:hypothetical protein
MYSITKHKDKRNIINFMKFIMNLPHIFSNEKHMSKIRNILHVFHQQSNNIWVLTWISPFTCISLFDVHFFIFVNNLPLSYQQKWIFPNKHKGKNKDSTSWIWLTWISSSKHEYCNSISHSNHQNSCLWCICHSR